jgi:Na+/H+ antiporter NhaD/arsenite permease-like protein
MAAWRPDVDVYIAGGIFLVAYALIASERIDRTVVALLGAMLVIVLGVVSQQEAFAAVDFNVIFLLVGMMVMAGALRKTGFFEYVAGHAIRLSRGEPFRLLVSLAVFTAVLSAFLDSVTTVVLIAPIMLAITRTLRVNPFPYLISLVFASNIGGTATLIGDPPNILIGSAANLSFVDFLLNLTPVVTIILVAWIGLMRLMFYRRIDDDHDRLDVLTLVDPAAAIKDRPLMIRCLVVLGLTMIGFLLHSALGLEVATIAMLGATVLMLVGGIKPHEAFEDVEWSTLFFFVGLFILVEAIVQVGIIRGIADAVATAVAGRQGVATIGILWFSALVSAIVDNIPYTATAIPIINRLAAGGLQADPMWWALSLGACLGGNMTIVGASANVVVANMAAREGHAITFWQFLRYGTAVVIVSMLISTAYLYVRYLM